MGSPRFRSIEAEGFVVTEAWFPPGAVLEPHTHERAILAVMLYGGFRTEIGTRSLACDQSYAWTEPLGEQHSNHVGSEGAHALVIQPDWRREEVTAPFAHLLDRVHLFRDAGVVTEASRTLAEFRIRDHLSALSVEGRATTMLALSARVRWRDGNGHRPPAWLLRVRDMLHDEWRTPRSLSEMARAAGVHQCHLAHEFRRYYGGTVCGYLRRLRLNWAVSQLAQTRAPASWIALDAGYCDQSHFTREMKATLGVTPSQFRKMAAS
jgi:AraC family transcriptional regulator